MPKYKKRNRSDSGATPTVSSTSMQEEELVLKLKKDELFDQYVLLPHSELNSTVYGCVDSFVEKYKGETLKLSICTGPVSTIIQDVFREVYRSHYEDELQKVDRYLKRHYIRVIALIFVSIVAFFISSYLAGINPEETIVSYVIANVSCFCLWEIGYTQFATHDVIDEKKRITRALNATIEFQ